MLIHKKDDIEFVTEFLCLLGHPVQTALYIHMNQENMDKDKIQFRD